MSPKQLAARTERNLKALKAMAHKQAEDIGYRFSDIDQTMVNGADELLGLVDHWIEEQREYMAEILKDEPDRWRL